MKALMLKLVISMKALMKASNIYESINAKASNIYESINARGSNIYESINAKASNIYESINAKASIEINSSKKKWLVYGTYNPSKSQILNHLSILGKSLNQCMPLYDNFILMGDFNSEVIEEAIGDFCELFNLKNLVKDSTCYKTLKIPHVLI